MHKPAALVVLIIASCSSPGKPPAAPPTTGSSADAEPAYLCPHRGLYGLYAFVAGPDALDIAQREYDAASAVENDPAAAARHYLACAAAYRAVPDGFAELDRVIENTRICYRNAMTEYYNGQLIEREGRAAVTAALAGETRVKAEMEAELAAETECGPPEE